MTYHQKKAVAIEQFKTITTKGKVSLKPKFTSHFFRKRKKSNTLDLTNFNQVISINTQTHSAELEGLTTFYDLSLQCLKHNLLPYVVPELRNITIGGTISGLGVEASSFRYGLVHDSVIECDVLTGNGKVISCSKTQLPDLFFSLPNSLGTIGYILKCKIHLRPVKKYVHVKFLRFDSAEKYFQELKDILNKSRLDFIDGVIFSAKHFVIITGNFIDKLPINTRLNDFKNNIYWQYVENKDNSQAYLTTWDYLWRWDTDVFWSIHDSPLAILENRLFRKILGPLVLRSNILIKLTHIYHQARDSEIVKNIRSLVNKNDNLKESILQDLGIDINQCASFMKWHDKILSTYPIWICPVKNIKYKNRHPLHNVEGKYLVDIGIYKGRKRPINTPENYYNRLLEKKVIELKGMKALYSLSFFSKDEFGKMYDYKSYTKIKNKYDPDNIFPDLYSKVVGRTTL